MILSEPDLVRWGERIGREVLPPLVVALRGPLGAGKSVLARAVARGAGVRGPLPSPTFNLVFRYRTPTSEVVHLDLFRIRDPDELPELGWDELGAPGEIVLVEWPERAGDRLPEHRWEVGLSMPKGVAPLRGVTVRKVGDPPALPPLPVEPP
ncbi:MAG: tRNA (adenosine(37)-N6)-threonylcarbamoyltransferase complex ATPase subunit type 1 TsaE [Gemmatimonadota bacterium]|nr:tRNA (adenosine(37)-N6)-threonylcarbamoyltransferase complex ATPase subunit type 1 TsaE [Gemmatimonadota bacterium]